MEADAGVDFRRPNPVHGDFTKWAQQGVLLLNAILTVRAKASNSHQKQGWEQFTDFVIKAIDKQKEGVVFMLWGKKAMDKEALLTKGRHCVLKGVHPSPLAGSGFKTCKHFGEAQAYLEKTGKGKINWNLQ